MGALLLVLSFFAIASLYQYQRLKHANQRLALVNDLFMPLSQQVAQIQSHLQTLSDDLRDTRFPTNESRRLIGTQKLSRELYPLVIQKKLGRAKALIEDPGLSGAEFTWLLDKLAEVEKRLGAFLAAGERKAFDQNLEGLRNALNHIAKKSEKECDALTRAVESEANDNLLLLSLMAGFILVLGFAALWMSYRVLNPLPELIDKLKKISSGDLSQTIKVKRSANDEISILAREYNRMLAALKERDRQIQQQQTDLIKNERLAAIGELSAEVAHEIRNPLNSISLNIEWLESEWAESGCSADIKETLSSVSQEITRLNQITERHLARARVGIENSQMTKVNELINEIVSFDKDPERKISFETDLWPEEVFIRGDKTRLKQAFVNVVKNAKEAMPHGGTIQVKTEVKKNVAQILFKDSGCGMSLSTRKKSFTPFFTTKAQGTGIGLSLTKQVVDEMNGVVECQSEVGKGTSFLFQFPV